MSGLSSSGVGRKASRSNISLGVLVCQIFFRKYGEEAYEKYIGLLPCRTDAGCLCSKENKASVLRTKLPRRLLVHRVLKSCFETIGAIFSLRNI